jgi:hypothetical protein
MHVCTSLFHGLLLRVPRSPLRSLALPVLVCQFCFFYPLFSSPSFLPDIDALLLSTGFVSDPVLVIVLMYLSQKNIIPARLCLGLSSDYRNRRLLSSTTRVTPSSCSGESTGFSFVPQL